jgi:exodeoxyribonuclease VII small subunit
MAKKSTPRLQDTLSQLEALISKMEDEEVSLEDSLATFEHGIKLARDAQATLEKAEQRVQLLQEENGKPLSESFEAKDAE